MFDLDNILPGLKTKQQSLIVINGFLDPIAQPIIAETAADLAFAAP